MCVVSLQAHATGAIVLRGRFGPLPLWCIQKCTKCRVAAVSKRISSRRVLSRPSKNLKPVVAISVCLWDLTGWLGKRHADCGIFGHSTKSRVIYYGIHKPQECVCGRAVGPGPFPRKLWAGMPVGGNKSLISDSTKNAGPGETFSSSFRQRYSLTKIIRTVMASPVEPSRGSQNLPFALSRQE